jgi:hypothetical protein
VRFDESIGNPSTFVELLWLEPRTDCHSHSVTVCCEYGLVTSCIANTRWSGLDVRDSCLWWFGMCWAGSTAIVGTTSHVELVQTAGGFGGGDMVWGCTVAQ